MAIGDVPYAMGPEHSHSMEIDIALPSKEYLSMVPDCKGALRICGLANAGMCSCVCGDHCAGIKTCDQR